MVAPVQTFDPKMASAARDQRVNQWTKALAC